MDRKYFKSSLYQENVQNIKKHAHKLVFPNWCAVEYFSCSAKSFYTLYKHVKQFCFSSFWSYFKLKFDFDNI